MIELKIVKNGVIKIEKTFLPNFTFNNNFPFVFFRAFGFTEFKDKNNNYEIFDNCGSFKIMIKSGDTEILNFEDTLEEHPLIKMVDENRIEKYKDITFDSPISFSMGEESFPRDKEIYISIIIKGNFLTFADENNDIILNVPFLRETNIKKFKEVRADYTYYIRNDETRDLKYTVLRWNHTADFTLIRKYNDGTVELGYGTRSWSVTNSNALDITYSVPEGCTVQNVNNSTTSNYTTSLVANGIQGGGSGKFYHKIDANRRLGTVELSGVRDLYSGDSTYIKATVKGGWDSDVSIDFTLNPSRADWFKVDEQGTKNEIWITNIMYTDGNWTSDHVLKIQGKPSREGTAYASEVYSMKFYYPDVDELYANGHDVGSNIGSFMCHQTLRIDVTYKFLPPDWTPNPKMEIITQDKNVHFSKSGTTFYMSYSLQTLTSDKQIQFSIYDHQRHGGRFGGNFYVTIKPSLTGVKLDIKDVTLNYSNNYQSAISAIPQPPGTGAPVTFRWESTNPNELAINGNGRNVTLQGVHSNKNNITLKVTASLTGGNLSFSDTCNVKIHPNMRIFNSNFKNGQPYVYDNSNFQEVKELYVYDNGSFHKDKVN